MGIQYFSQYFKTAKVCKASETAKYVYVDASYFWEKQLLRGGNVHTNFLSVLFRNILYCDLQRADSQLERIEIVFDNADNRNYMKWWRCLKRMEALFALFFGCSLGNGASRQEEPTPREKFNVKRLEYLLWSTEQILDDADPNVLSKDELRSKVHFVIAPSDTDDYITLQCKLNSERTPWRTLFIASGADLQASTKELRVKAQSVFSGDSDFMSMFSRCGEHAAVYDLESMIDGHRVVTPNNLLLLNYDFNYEHATLAAINEAIERAFETYINAPQSTLRAQAWLTRDFMLTLCIKIVAMTSANDYITCSLFDVKCLCATISQISVWFYRHRFVPSRSFFTISFVMCYFFSYFSQDAYSLDVASPSKLKTLINNVLRVFVLKRNGPDEYEFLPSSFSAKTPTTHSGGADEVQLLSIAELCATFRERPDIIHDEKLRHSAQASFKSALCKNFSTIRTQHLSGAIACYLEKLQHYKANSFVLLNETETTQRVVDLIEMSNTMTKCTGLFVIGLVKIWFWCDFDAQAFSNGVMNCFWSLALFGRIYELYSLTQSGGTRDFATVNIKQLRVAVEEPKGPKRKRTENNAAPTTDMVMANAFTVGKFIAYCDDFLNQTL